MEVVPGLHWVERIWDTKVYVLIENDRLVIVDAAMPGRAGAVWGHLGQLGYAPEDVDEIWLTHGDIDHMGSVAALKAGSAARVVAHAEDAPLVDGRASRALGQVPFSGPYRHLVDWTIRFAFRYQPADVDVMVSDGDTLGGWRVVHAPGHTSGSVCFHHPEKKVILVGDALNHRRGRLGAPPPMFTPDMSQARASIRRIAELDFEVCCFGHGSPITEGAQQRVQAFAATLPH